MLTFAVNLNSDHKIEECSFILRLWDTDGGGMTVVVEI